MDNRLDARRLTHAQLTELRKRAVAAVQNGESPEDVARVLRVSRAAVYGWLARFRAGGWDRLNAAKRGGRKPKLSGADLKWLYDTVTFREPAQFQFPFALWTSKMLRQLLQQQRGIKLSKSSVCRLLNQLGLSAQRPLWRAYQQDPQRVERWLAEEYPALARRARREGAEIWFEDEAGIRSDHHSGTTWAPRGQTPIVSTTGARFGLNVISAVNRRGDLRFMCVKGRVNAGVFIKFLQRLIKDAAKKVFLIVDGHPTHQAKKVQRFLAEHNGQIEMFLLPPYAPELNPDELVWNDLKNNCLGRVAHHCVEELRKRVQSYLRSLQKLPDRIRSFFRAPTTRYAMCV